MGLPALSLTHRISLSHEPLLQYERTKVYKVYGGNFFYLIPCLHQFRGHSWFPIQQIIVKFILPGSTRFGALP